MVTIGIYRLADKFSSLCCVEYAFPCRRRYLARRISAATGIPGGAHDTFRAEPGAKMVSQDNLACPVSDLTSALTSTHHGTNTTHSYPDRSHSCLYCLHSRAPRD